MILNLSYSNEVEGLEIADAWIEQIWPGATPQEVNNELINTFIAMLVIAKMRAGESNPEIAGREVRQYTTRIH